jgi:hypothetical protein
MEASAMCISNMSAVVELCLNSDIRKHFKAKATVKLGT